MKRILICCALILLLVAACGKKERPKNKPKDVPEKQFTADKTEKTELEETVIQTKEVDTTTQLNNNVGIMIVRFLLENTEENQLHKLPNFRIKGPKRLEIDNSSSDIQKDAIHIYKIPAGRYSISSLYSINAKGEYEFDKPFPSNQFVIERGKINYIGDVQVRMEEEHKSSNIYTRKLKLKLPANNDETIQIIQDRFKTLLEKYPLERRIINFR